MIFPVLIVTLTLAGIEVGLRVGIGDIGIIIISSNNI